MDTLPTFTFEFPDSEVARVQAAGDALHVHFSAARVRRLADGAERVVEGYLGEVTLSLSGARWRETPAVFGRVAAGRLCLDGRAIATLAIPTALAGALSLELSLANGERVVLDADGATLTARDTAAFTEDASC